ncbi:prolyl oligopeptidase family serine peptidase [Kineosporia mesophila]|uniref:prolyl oligopeptidase family serine peptidase n=1 Tax=Kineosporia mesophila TaxID=566012 RepID=UPI0038B3CE5E
MSIRPLLRTLPSLLIAHNSEPPGQGRVTRPGLIRLTASSAVPERQPVGETHRGTRQTRTARPSTTTVKRNSRRHTDAWAGGGSQRAGLEDPPSAERAPTAGSTSPSPDLLARGRDPRPGRTRGKGTWPWPWPGPCLRSWSPPTPLSCVLVKWPWPRRFSGPGPGSGAIHERAAVLESEGLSLSSIGPQCQVLLSHGLLDDQVPFQQSVSAARELRLRRIPCEIALFPGAGHSLARADRTSRWYKWVLDALNTRGIRPHGEESGTAHGRGE